MHAARACLAGCGGFSSLCQTQLNMTYGWIKELGNKLGLLIESLSIKRTAPSSSCSRSLKVIVCWICCCLFMVSHIDVRPACCRACVHARFACSDLLAACLIIWLDCFATRASFPKMLRTMPNSEPISQHSLASAASHGVLSRVICAT